MRHSCNQAVTCESLKHLSKSACQSDGPQIALYLLRGWDFRAGWVQQWGPQGIRKINLDQGSVINILDNWCSFLSELLQYPVWDAIRTNSFFRSSQLRRPGKLPSQIPRVQGELPEGPRLEGSRGVKWSVKLVKKIGQVFLSTTDERIEPLFSWQVSCRSSRHAIFSIIAKGEICKDSWS